MSEYFGNEPETEDQQFRDIMVTYIRLYPVNNILPISTNKDFPWVVLLVIV